MCACAAVGLSAAKRLYDSERLWRAWVLLLQRLHAELQYTARPVQELLHTMRREELKALGWLAEYDDPREELRCPARLAVEERAFAGSFFAFLGASDLEGQLAHIERHRQRAQEAADAASERAKRLSGAYAMTGVCAGLCVGLMLL